MTSRRVQLNRKNQVADGTLAFYFERPADFQFKAGQFMNVTLVEPPETDAEGNTRSFSIASAPLETDLMIATRMRDTAFKRVLKAMALGTQVAIAGPFGSFTLRQNSQPAVLLAGGIGITPFRSMLLQAVSAKLSRRLFLFYSNRRPEDAAFLEELQELDGKAEEFQFIPTMTDMQKSRQPWDGETGRINPAMLAKYVGDLNGPMYYAAGPPGLVAAMQNVLQSARIKEDDVVTEEFPGY
ncbi:MAG TPA: FAD-dependent oxidoreductase [Thermoanaerobaculia bacterium]|nr:FAD-dependent oxidoreductase [Thermoanaerobaculia bacterium]